MKTSMTALTLILMSVSAQAAPTALLELSSRGVGVSPMAGLRQKCLVLDDGTVFTRTIAGDIATPSTRKVKWKGIPNVTVLKSLIAESSNGLLVDRKSGPLPIGGRIYVYNAYQGGNAIALKTQHGPVTMRINTSPVTPRLVSFLETNCPSVE